MKLANKWPIWCDYLLLLGLAVFYFFWKLGSASLASRDESTYVLAMQGIMFTGDWWSPTINGQPFITKPPLKLWLTIPFLKLLGPENLNFAQRVPDAIFGILTVLLVYWIGRSLFASRLAGVLAGISLITCKHYTLIHGPRQNTMDALLVLLFTGAVWCGYKLIAALEARDHRAAWRSALFGGAALGLGGLTKSVSVYPALLIILLYLVLDGRLLKVVALGWKQILTVLLLAIALPLPYFLWHSLQTDGGYLALIQYEVVKRATEGYVNKDEPFFYFDRLFNRGEMFPPLLLAAGLLVAFLGACRRRGAELLLSVWIWLILIIYSIATSRLPQYIAPAFPAMALSIGGLLAGLYGMYVNSRSRSWAYAGLIFFALGCGLVLVHGAELVGDIKTASRRIPFDQVQRDVARAIDRQGGRSKIVMFEGQPQYGGGKRKYFRKLPEYRRKMKSLDVAFREMAYRNSLFDYVQPVFSVEDARAAALDPAAAFLWTDGAGFRSLAALRPFQRYAVLPPALGRHRTLIVLSYSDLGRLKQFRTPQTVVNLDGPNFRRLFGWDNYDSQLNGLWAAGNRSAFLVDADWVYENSPTFLSFTVTPQYAGMRLQFFINNSKAGEFSAGEKGIGKVIKLDVPPGTWLSGSNAVLFHASLPENTKLGQLIRSFLLKDLAVGLAFGGQPLSESTSLK